MVWVNDHHKNDPRSIWGGFGDSGYGKENGWDALKSYLVKRNIVVRTAPSFDDWFGGGREECCIGMNHFISVISPSFRTRLRQTALALRSDGGE